MICRVNPNTDCFQQTPRDSASPQGRVLSVHHSNQLQEFTSNTRKDWGRQLCHVLTHTSETAIDLRTDVKWRRKYPSFKMHLYKKPKKPKKPTHNQSYHWIYCSTLTTLIDPYNNCGVYLFQSVYLGLSNDISWVPTCIATVFQIGTVSVLLT